MIKTLALFLFFALITGSMLSQDLTGLKLTGKKSSLKNYQVVDNTISRSAASEKTLQLKKRKTVNSYFGAGYSFPYR